MAGGSSGVLMHLGALALKAVACPLPNILINRWVARTPGWERVCRMSNTWRRNCGGTSGRGTPVDMSHRSVAPQVGTGAYDSVREGAAPSGGGSVN